MRWEGKNSRDVVALRIRYAAEVTFSVTWRRLGFVITVPSGKSTVGTVAFPLFASRTSCSAVGSFSISMVVYSTPARSSWLFSRTQ
ncbi:hypothetical protein FAIPA1_40224 [Frankia sp. AiPs1]